LIPADIDGLKVNRKALISTPQPLVLLHWFILRPLFLELFYLSSLSLFAIRYSLFAIRYSHFYDCNGFWG